MVSWLLDGETIILEERRSGRLEGRLRAFTGSAIATDRRLVFLERPRWAYAFGLLGMLLTKPTELGVDAPLETIAEVGVGRHGRAKTLEVELASGASHRLMIKDPGPWLEALNGRREEQSAA
jgi:hypothetical protein